MSEIQRVSSGGEFEAKIGYCRSVIAGGVVYVSGTVGQGDTVVAQCRSALAIIEDALANAGCGFQDVVRVTYMLPNRHDFKDCWPELTSCFGDHPPAATMIECGLIDPKYLIEIEVTALIPA